MKKVNALVLGLAVLLAVGCGGDEPEPDVSAVNASNLKLTLTSYSFFNGQDLVAEYTYNPQKRIIQIDYKTGNTVVSKQTIEYNANGQVSRKNIHAAFEHYSMYEYYPDGMLRKINNFLFPTGSSSATPTDSREFTYYNDKKIKQEKHFLPQDSVTPVYYIDFTYPTDSTALLKNYDLQQGNPALNNLFYTQELKFDKKNNPAKLLGVIDNTETFNRGYIHNITYSRQTYANNTVGTTYTRTYSYNAENFPVTVTHYGQNNTTTESFVYNWL